ncbi:hypothetical protein [Aquimarina sp. 2201CG5-10]|uniref:hypothetical protein n=1 Tax=Aquimarina callyspongiae TaxID=3098150 RepID=UPI002AB3A824|nr:hypothetical protein [Aquimarina sp. 2201CG5-10]MDY8134471.1 hypothetical protein [Aquimarina sp. 2201CG5-10]
MKLNFKEILSNIGYYILAGIFFLGFFILYAGVGGRNRDGNITFIWIGLLVLLPFGIWFLIEKIKDKKIKKQLILKRKELIRTGEKIVIDLDNVEIKSNSWNQEFIIGAGEHQRIEHRDINYNYIELKIPYGRQKIKYNLHIDMELTKLKMHFAIKEKTYLYVDPSDINNNYLDLSFLEYNE